MRVVAGHCRGRPLVAPAGRTTRPTSDRVREAIFNALGSMGEIDGATVVDLFAGTGALGIEALSRGASRATFVERDRRSLAALEQNLATADLVERATVVDTEVERWLATEAASGSRYDLALADPPYAYGAWADLLAVVPADTLVVETDRDLDLGPRWIVARSKWYGTTLVVIARLAAGGIRQQPE